MTTGAWHGEAYRSAAIMQRTWGMRLVDTLAPRPGEAILDLGCGEGTLTAEIARRVLPGGRVVGIDASPSMIEAAQSHAAPNLDFRVLPAEQLDETALYDAAYSNAVLHWIRDHETAIGNLHRALKPGGRFVAEFGGDGNCERFFAFADALAIEDYSRWHKAPPKQHTNRYPTAAEFSRTLQRAGFVRRHVVLRARAARFGRREAAEAWFRTIGHPYLAPLPPELHEPFVRELFDRYGARPNIRAGRWTVRFMRIIATAVA